MRRIAPQQYRSAAQQRQANLLIGIAAMRSERRFPGGRQLPFVFQRVPGESAFPKRGLARSGAHRTSARVTYCNAANRRLTVSQSGASSASQKRRPPVGGLSLGRKRPRRACTVNTVRLIVWRQIQQMQDLNPGFALHMSACDVFATAQQGRPGGGKPILWFNQ
jgi:hypothetical protein